MRHNLEKTETALPDHVDANTRNLDSALDELRGKFAELNDDEVFRQYKFGVNGAIQYATVTIRNLKTDSRRNSKDTGKLRQVTDMLAAADAFIRAAGAANTGTLKRIEEASPLIYQAIFDAAILHDKTADLDIANLGSFGAVISEQLQVETIAHLEVLFNNIGLPLPLGSGNKPSPFIPTLQVVFNEVDFKAGAVGDERNAKYSFHTYYQNQHKIDKFAEVAMTKEDDFKLARMRKHRSIRKKITKLR